MDAIPLHKIAIVLPFTRFLSEIGAPVERGFRQAKLPFGALENVKNCVPTHRFWLFVGDMARLEGIEDLGYRVGQRFGLNCIQPGLSTHLCQSPTLYHALTKTINLANNSTSRARIGFFPQPLGDHVHCFHQPSFDARNPSFDHFNWFALTALVEVVRLFAGST